MRVLYALLCEDAETRDDGRLDVHGVFHQLYAPGFPAKQDHMVLAVALEWDAGEAGAQAFRIDLMDPDRSPAVTVSGTTEITQTPAGEAPPQTRLVMPLEGIVFPRAGTYLFELHLNELIYGLAPIHLVEHPDAR